MTSVVIIRVVATESAVALLGEHARDQALLAVKLDLSVQPFAERHSVSGPDIDWDQFTEFVAAAMTDAGVFALQGLFLGPAGNNDAAFGL